MGEDLYLINIKFIYRFTWQILYFFSLYELELLYKAWYQSSNSSIHFVEFFALRQMVGNEEFGRLEQLNMSGLIWLKPV